MRILHSVLLGLTAALLAAAANPKDDAAKKEMGKLAGTWKGVSAERSGQADKVFENAVLTMTADGKFSVKFTDGSGGDGTYKLDPSKKPNELEYTVNYRYMEKPYGITYQGIYALEGDTLKICSSGKERPKEFATKTNSGQTLFVLNRQKTQTAKAPPPPAAPVFTDKGLEAAVRAVLQETKGELNDGNLVNVYILEASGKSISNLKGLEKCKNLALLKLTDNQIVDLIPLKDLTNLQSLDLAGNKITDVAPLAGLTKLQYLELSNNQIGNVAPLSGLTSLSALYFTGNKISDITPLGNLSKLASLSLGRNQIHDISALAKVTKISTLELKDNQIADIAPLAKQTELSILMLERNKISDLTPLVTAAKADSEGQKRFAPYLRLYLSGNPLSDAAKSNQLAALKGFGVRVEN